MEKTNLVDNRALKTFLNDEKKEVGGAKIVKVKVDESFSIKIKSTDKVWDDGVPVVKYIERGEERTHTIRKGTYSLLQSFGRTSSEVMIYWKEDSTWYWCIGSDAEEFLSTK